MSIIDRIAFYKNRRDEVPNQELARDLAKTGNRPGIREIASGLTHANPNVRADIGTHADQIMKIMETGSVITVDNGVKTLAVVASKEAGLNKELLSFLFEHLAGCRPKDVPQHSEKTLVAVDQKSRADFVSVLESRLPELSPSQVKRVTKVISLAGT
jgi:hypothetical protein